MLRWRLMLGFSIAISIATICWLDVFLESCTQIPGLALFPLLLLLITLGGREMLRLANRNHVYPVPYVVYLGCYLIAASAWGTFAFQHYSNQPGTPIPAVDVRLMEDADSAEFSQLMISAVVSETEKASSMVATENTVDVESEEAKKSEVTRRRLLEKLEHLTPGNWALSAFAVAVILVFLQEMYTFVRPGAVNIRISYSIFTIVYVGLLPTFLAQIRLCHGLSALCAFIAIIKMGDVGAYTIGRLFGRNKMAPSLSPGKTIEGAFGALLFSVLTSLLFFYWIMPWMGTVCSQEKVVWWILYGAALGFLGMLGDLAESLMKRDAEIKDAGTLVPGFGGVLDILDSLLISAPVAYAFLTLELLFD
ncbi:MAG: phosphatidate cytidylyltransferase [Planctomycetia bacterium]|nr:phosphatidate cytidylyltransferase [Planctomycetia bacterium]